MKIYSGLTYPLFGVAKDGEVWAITPGGNTLRDDVWEAIKDDDRIVKRVDQGQLEPGQSATRARLEKFTHGVPYSEIGNLCAKSRPIPDLQIFDGTQVNLANPLESWERAMKRSMDKVAADQAELREFVEGAVGR